MWRFLRMQVWMEDFNNIQYQAVLMSRLSTDPWFYELLVWPSTVDSPNEWSDTCCKLLVKLTSKTVSKVRSSNISSEDSCVCLANVRVCIFTCQSILNAFLLGFCKIGQGKREPTFHTSWIQMSLAEDFQSNTHFADYPQCHCATFQQLKVWSRSISSRSVAWAQHAGQGQEPIKLLSQKQWIWWCW